MYEEFETQREFNITFPSKFYICSRCNSLTDNPYQCPACQNQANNIFLQDKTFFYKIKETGNTSQIFIPIEKIKEIKNGDN